MAIFGFAQLSTLRAQHAIQDYKLLSSEDHWLSQQSRRQQCLQYPEVAQLLYQLFKS